MRPRTRFAPSPTGNLHIGNARTALFNWLFARRMGGDFVLRIEDTDIERSSLSFEASILEDLKWLMLNWDEGPDIGGKWGPYRQSERLGLYRELVDKLSGNGVAYNCYCTKVRLEELKKSQLASGIPPRYDNRCRGIKAGEAPKGASPAIRFKVPPKDVSFADGVHGEVIFDSKSFGDFVIMGSDGAASYNFAVVADDALMGITDVIRGDDHLSNTPRQILLFEALGFKPPRFSHIPLVLGHDRLPLGKRDLSASLRSLREEGYLPEAVLNSIARLGWSPGEGFLSLDDAARLFDIGRLSRSPSVFDPSTLKRYNKMAINNLSHEELFRLMGLTADEELKRALEAVKPNAETIGGLKRLIGPFTGELSLTEDARSLLSEPYSKEVVKAFFKEAEGADTLDETNYLNIMNGVKRATGEKGKRLYMPIRAALTGQAEGIELVTILKLLGRDKVIERLKKIGV
ncbi:MAG: glutamate--tRNA ligase [Deltaproteobacteria bacterium]|nr:glutamate--tRNA ligase [Deltaproteobacteria bacterium]